MIVKLYKARRVHLKLFYYFYLLNIVTVVGAPQEPAPTWFTAANRKSYVIIGLKFSIMYGELTDQVRLLANVQS